MDMTFAYLWLLLLRAVEMYWLYGLLGVCVALLIFIALRKCHYNDL